MSNSSYSFATATDASSTDRKMGDNDWVYIKEFLTNNSRGNDHFKNEYPSAEVIGREAFGVVYKAIKNTQKVAIKEINVESLKDLAAAVREVVILKDVPPHPNVVKMYDDLSWYTTDDVLSPASTEEILDALKGNAAEPVDCKGEFLLTDYV